MNRRIFIYGGIAAVGVATGAALVVSRSPRAGPVTVDAIGDRIQTLPRARWPVFAEPASTRELYRYAVEHADDLRYMPCFCGCYRFGHASNRDCYVKSFNADGTITFTSHGAT